MADEQTNTGTWKCKFCGRTSSYGHSQGLRPSADNVCDVCSVLIVQIKDWIDPAPQPSLHALLDEAIKGRATRLQHV